MSSEKEFVFNVFIKKLELRNDLLTSDETIVKFEWGENKDLNFNIKADRINVPDFDVKTIIEFKEHVDSFVQSLESTPFKLTVFEKKKVNTEPPDGDSKETDGGDKEKIEPKVDGEPQKENLEKICEAECPWPTKLISSFKSNKCSPTPVVETYELKNGEDKIGLLTLSLLLHFKCEEDIKSIIKGPYVDKEGKLGIFKDANECLDPNDIFFVIGNPPCPRRMGANILATCGSQGPCPGRFDANRYKLMQGSLINDCNAVGGCGAPGCCEVKGDMEMCREVLEEIEAKTFAAKKRRPRPVCPIDPCERIFGPMSESCDGLTGTDIDIPCHAEFHTLDCNQMRKKRQRRKKQTCRCRFAEQSGTSVCRNNEELIDDILKNNQFDRRRKEILYPHTNPAPELLTPANPISIRCCPICCEDISWVPLYGPCPKCGFKVNAAQPVEELPYDDQKTAEDILDQLKQDVKKFRREKKISKFGACNCTPYNECLNCQLRKLSRHRAKKQALEAGGEEGQNDEEGLKQNDLRRPSKVRHVAEKENKANNIIGEAVAKYNRKQSKNDQCDYKIPSLKRVIKWCKKQSDLKARGNLSGSSLCTTSSFSSESSGCGERLKDKRIPECNFSVSISEKASSGTNKSKQSAKKEANQSKRRQNKKSKYFSKDEYPGVILGHKDCVGEHKKVPRYMGWLWSASINNSNRGWRPGAVRRETHKVMKYFLKDKNFQEDMTLGQTYEQQKEEICMPSLAGITMPTIRVTKKQGKYKITVHPMRDPSKPLDPRDTRSLPIEFTIEKDPLEIMKRQIKSRLKEMGFHTCTCGKPIYECECRGDLERDNLEDALDDICEKLCVPHLKSKIYLSDTTKSDSEMDMEFSPPAAKLRRPLPKKPSIVYAETQCDQEDIKISTGRPDVWKINPQEVLSRYGHGCGGMSKPPPCWPPTDSQSPKKAPEQEAKSKQSGKPDKPKKGKGDNKPTKSKIEKGKETSKTYQTSKEDQSKKLESTDRVKPGESKKSPDSKKPSDEGKDTAERPEKPEKSLDTTKKDKLATGIRSADLKKSASKSIQPASNSAKVQGQGDKKNTASGKQEQKPQSTIPDIPQNKLQTSQNNPQSAINKPQGPQNKPQSTPNKTQAPQNKPQQSATDPPNKPAASQKKPKSPQVKPSPSTRPKILSPIPVKSDRKTMSIPSAEQEPRSSMKPRPSSSQPRPSIRSVVTPIPSEAGRRQTRQLVARPAKPVHLPKSVAPNRSVATKESPVRPKVIAVTTNRPRKPTKPVLLPTVCPIETRFSMSQIPTLKTKEIQARKSPLCREASLMGVRFKSLECEKAAILSCPLPPSEPEPCLVPCYIPHGDYCWT